MQPQEQLLAGDLGGGLTQRRIGELVFGDRAKVQAARRPRDRS